MNIAQEISQSTTLIIAISTLISLLILFVRIRPEMNKILVPYHKSMDCEKVGFIQFRSFLSVLCRYQLVAFFRYQMPLFATIYLFLVFLFDSFFSIELVNSKEYFYYFTGAWAITFLQPGKIRSNIAIIIVIISSYFIGSNMSNSIFGGYVGVSFFLSLLFAYSFEDNFMFKLVNHQIKIETKKTLLGDKIGKIRIFFVWIGYFYQIIIPIFMAYSLYKIYINSEISKSHLSLRYIDFSVDNFFVALPLIIVFMNISLTTFGGIFNFLQEDFLKALGERILYKNKHLSSYIEQEKMLEKLATSSDNKNLGLPIDMKDRLLPIDLVSITKFRIALSFFCLDALLTVTSVLGISFLPGINVDQIFTLSSILKVPIYIVFIIKSINRLMVYISIKKKWFIDSKTYKIEVINELKYYLDIKKLFKQIQKQNLLDQQYIDVSDNKYLLWLAGKAYFIKRSSF